MEEVRSFPEVREAEAEMRKTVKKSSPRPSLIGAKTAANLGVSAETKGIQRISKGS